MATVHGKIIEAFLSELATSEAVDSQKLKRLKKLLADSEKPKADDFVQIFNLPAGDDIK